MSNPVPVSPPISSHKQAKLDSLLAVAANTMNTRGASSLSLSTIAKQLELSRNGLYRYVKDRNDLIRQCYLRSCEHTFENLSRTEKEQDTKERLSRFIIESLSAESEQAVVNDFEFLPDAYRHEVASALNKNIELLAAILQQGQDSGVFCSFNASAISYSLYGVLDWALIWFHWANDGKNSYQEHGRKIADAVVDWILNGIAPSTGPFGCRHDSDALIYKHYHLLNRSDSAAHRKQQLVDAAARLFNQKGVGGVSLDEIAGEIGATKGMIYNQFRSKDELVSACYESALDQHEVFFSEVESMEGTGLEKLLTLFHLNCQAHLSDTPPLALQYGLLNQPDCLLSRAQSLSGRIRVLFSLAESDKSARSLDTHIVDVAAGASFGVRYRSLNDNILSTNDIADEITRIFAHGVCA